MGSTTTSTTYCRCGRAIDPGPPRREPAKGNRLGLEDYSRNCRMYLELAAGYPDGSPERERAVGLAEGQYWRYLEGMNDARDEAGRLGRACLAFREGTDGVSEPVDVPDPGPVPAVTEGPFDTLEHLARVVATAEGMAALAARECDPAVRRTLAGHLVTDWLACAERGLADAARRVAALRRRVEGADGSGVPAVAEAVVADWSDPDNEE